MNETLNKRKDRVVKLCKPVVLSLFLMLAGACDKGDDDPCEPIPGAIEDSIQNPINDTIQPPIRYAFQNPIEVNKLRETVNELSDEMKQDVIAYFQNIFCPIWNALWPDRPDLQFNPEDFPEIISKADVRYGDEYFNSDRLQ